jgi:HD-GYP domain-containing protein (c-di-GMP phosphodiesterase class II)
VDTFDAMTNDRPYQPARTPNEALEEIDRCSGSLFDPKIVFAFRDQCHHLIGHPPHSATNDRAAPLRPELITGPA